MNAKEARAYAQRKKAEREATKARRTKRILWGALAAAVAVIVVGGFAFANAGNTAPANVANVEDSTPNGTKITTVSTTKTGAEEKDATSSSKDKAKLTAELKKILDVANAPIKDATCTTVIEKTGGKVTDDTYGLLLETLKGVEKGNNTLRQWSDALSIPLKGATPKEKREYITRAICEEPIIGVSLAHLFAHLEVEGVRVLDLQSTAWLEAYNVQPGEINDIVADFMPLTQWKLENISKKDAPDEVYEEALEANHRYQELGSRLNLLLSKYQLGEVLQIDSKHHYHLKGGGLSADSIPEVAISKEVDSKPALVFYLTKKTDDCKPISVLGFNTGDKRPMLGDTVSSCKELTTPPAPPIPLTPPETPWHPPLTCEGDCGTPPPPVCVYDCVPLQPKDPSLDPWQQGNAPDGGGNNVNPGQGDPTNPVQPPDTTYVPPAPPVAPPPAATPDPTPPPAPEPSAPKPSAPETGCDASIPGVTC